MSLPFSRVQSHSSGLVQVHPEQDFPVCSIQVGNFNSIGLWVCPVKLFTQPVTGQAIRTVQSWHYHSLACSQRLLQGCKPRNVDCKKWQCEHTVLLTIEGEYTLTIGWLIPVGLFDGLLTHICPKYKALSVEEVHCCCILQVTDNNGRLTPHTLCIHQSYVASVGKQKERWSWKTEEIPNIHYKVRRKIKLVKDGYRSTKPDRYGSTKPDG